MLERHDWITPTLGGVPWLEKPPLYYWQAILAYKIFGVSDWSARLPSAFDATALIFALYWFLRRVDFLSALDGALMLTCTAGIVGFARAASTDMPLAATFAIALLAWWMWFEEGSRWFLATFYMSLALATLAKGPVAVFLAALIVGVFAAAKRSWAILVKSLWVPGVLLFYAVSLPWYLLVQTRNPQFLRVFILEHNLARFGTNLFHHPEPFWYYMPVTLLGWLPWTVFVVAAFFWAVREFREHELAPLDSFLIIWIGVTVVFFSISKSKLPGYILPAIPAGVLLLVGNSQSKNARRPKIALVILHAFSTAVLIFVALDLRYTLLRRHFEWNRALIVPFVVSALLALVIAILILKLGRRGLRIATLVPAVVTLSIAIRFGSAALNQTLSARAISDALAQVSAKNLPVAAVLVSREIEYGLHFYRNQPIPRYELGQAPGREHLVVARAGFQKAFARDIPGRKITFLGDFPAQNLEFFYISAK
jgi:4-amino-4-deoxy-L-arabinose transferase-like glycosyltransferase